MKTTEYDYKPFGAVLSKIGDDERESFINKEKDNESFLGDFCVRQF